jgi:predicted O-methyltransferase YrrM
MKLLPLPDDLKAHILAHFNAVTDGWCWEEKAIKLAEVVWTLKPKLTVEVGVFGGKSFIPMAAVVAHLDQNEGKHSAVGIDAWEATAALENNFGTAHEPFWKDQAMLDGVRARAVGRCNALASRSVKLVKDWSTNAIRDFSDGQINVISLDSNHSEATSFRDVVTWWAKLAPGGVFIFDDTAWESQQKAVNWLKERGEVIWEYNQNGNSTMMFLKS